MMKTPRKDNAMPKTARREGFNLKMKEETNMDHMGVVFTKTVAFIIVVSKTAETNNMKCKPKRIPRTEIRPKSFRNKLQLKDFLKGKIAAKMSEAIIKRHKAMEKILMNPCPFRKVMNIAAVPKRAPAIEPSRRANLLLLFGRIEVK